MKEINVGVIGAGYWGKKVIQEYLNLSKTTGRANLIGVSDFSPSAQSYCKDVLKIPNVYNNFEEILDRTDVDAVHICTPNETHYEIGMKALQAGKHVLMEKPMAVTSGEAFDLLATAKSLRKVLCVGQIHRFNNAIEACKELLHSGLVGKIFHLRLQWTNYEPLMLGRDIIFDLGPHPIDIMNNLLDKWPQTVYCSAKSYRQQKEEIAYISTEFEDGISAQVEMSWLLPGKIRVVDILGSNHSVRLDCLNQKIKLFDGPLNKHTIPIQPNNTILSELEHFIECILMARDDPASIKNGGILGARVVQVLTAAGESFRSKKVVRIDYTDEGRELESCGPLVRTFRREMDRLYR